MDKLINPLLINIYNYLDIYSLIKIYKLQLIKNFNENEKKVFYEIIWKLVVKNIKYYEKLYKPWKYNIQFGKFIYYFAAYNRIVPVYIDRFKWIELFLLK